MRKYSLLILFIAFPLFLLCQNISVKSFRLLNNDLDALVNYPVIDRSNGEKAALIKVVTTETGFEFGGGQLGIVKVAYKTAEIWVYVPAKLKAITIAHPKLGQLPNRFYDFDIPIESGKVYEMVLITGTVETIVRPTEIATQWLAINSKPEGASVFIEEQLVGTTPFTRKYPEGEYTYRLEFPKYNSQAGKVNLVGDKKVLNLILKPHFGSIGITSTPESGMLIYIDAENTGKITPATLEGVASGEHTLKLVSQWYQPQAKKVTVTDEGMATADFTMTPAFADITMTTNPAADILIDDKKVGNGSYSARMLAGIYTVKADKEKHYSAQQQVTVVAGIRQAIALNLKPMVGSLDITSTPFEAAITIDGKEYGTTPNTVKNLLVGDYTLTIKKGGYGTVTKNVTITENATTEVNEVLLTGLEIAITSTPTGARLMVDGVSTGSTPYTAMLSFGTHAIKLVNGEKLVEETITVVQGGKIHFDYYIPEDITDVDGNTYKTVAIGTQVWMAENLKTTKYRNGNSIPKKTDNASWANQTNGAYCWYNNDISNKSTYGALYNFYAVVDSRNLCPSGWHVPTDTEWTTLIDYLGGESVAGDKLKSTALWEKTNKQVSNNIGFSALPGGYRDCFHGSCYSIGVCGNWWSSSVFSRDVWYCPLCYYDSRARLSYFGMSSGFSVRCIKD
ncbi:MAG: PEGA domain-containing protein [Bacteroidales bacterium]|nr:PEGA domain-containing protein [Bacteroidales bacterium]